MAAVADYPDWESLSMPWDQAIVQVRWFAQQKRWIPDEVNVNGYLKAAYDGLQDAGVLTDDFGLLSLPAVREVDKDWPRVEMHVAQCEFDWRESGKMFSMMFPPQGAV